MADRATAPARRRLDAVDAARGAAMLFVCMSHFATEYFRRVPGSRTESFLTTAGMLASPTFVSISGMMLGYLHRSGRERFDRLRRKLLDRGLFFLLAGHPLIALAYRQSRGSYGRSLSAVFITDVIGACLIVGPFLVQRLAPARRVAAALLAYCLGWAVVLAWFPRDALLLDLKDILFGLEEGVETCQLWYSFPLVPWLCLYLASSAAGETLAGISREGHPGGVRRFVGRLAAGGLAFSVPLIAAAKYAKHVGALPGGVEPWSMLLSIHQKSPPGPVYAVFFGGAGMLLLYGMILWQERGGTGRLFRGLRDFGQVTFFAFVLQYFVYATLLYSLDLEVSPAWPLVFALSLATVLAGAYGWHRGGLNRFLTVGLAPRGGGEGG